MKDYLHGTMHNGAEVMTLLFIYYITLLIGAELLGFPKPNVTFLPRLYEYPNATFDVMVEENKSLKLNCGNIRSDSAVINVAWFVNETRLESWLNVQNGSEAALFLNNTPIENVGLYKCVINTPTGSVISSKTKIRLSYMHSFDYGAFDRQLHIEDVYLNSYLILSPPKISAEPIEWIAWSWIHENKTISNDFNVFVSSDGKLVILGVNQYHSGAYAVEAHHKHLLSNATSRRINVRLLQGETSSQFDLQSPIIILSPRDQIRVSHSYLNDDNRVVLECVAYYRFMDKVQIVWYHNQTLVLPGGRYLLQYFNRKLIINQPFSSNDSGVYTCEAYVMDMPYLNDKKDAWVEIHSLPTASITNFGSDTITVTPGTRVEIPCNVQGYPKPSVQWYFNGLAIENRTNLCCGNESALHRSSLGSLIIRQVYQSNVGVYQCEAWNAAGYSKIATVYLETDNMLIITNGPLNQTVIIGSNVALPCESSFAKIERIARKWYFKNQLVNTTNIRNIEIFHNGQLLIKQVGPINVGPYTCAVASGDDVAKQTGLLNIIEKPGMPLHTRAALINDSFPVKVEISWAAGFDGNSPIVKYSIEHRIMGNQNLWSDWEITVENLDKDQNSVVIDNLKPSAHYEFRVIAFNRFGPGLPSQPSNTLIMPQQPPAAAPDSVAGSARSSSSIMVQWQPPPPDQWNGDILGYILRYRLANYPDIPWQILNISDPRSRNHLIQDLITWREYQIQVAAYNERGMGVFSKALFITTLEGIPIDHPYNVSVEVLNSTAARVSFIPPPQQMVPGVNLGYKIELWRNYTNDSTVGDLVEIVKVLPYSLTKIEKLVDNLDKFGLYQVTVVCYTAQGDGPRSFPVQFRTRQDIPDPVRNLTVKDVLFDSIKLTWEKPLNPNGILTNYTVICRSSNDTDLKRTFSIPPNATSFTLRGLTASTKYALEFFASTEIGSGPIQILEFVSAVPPELPGPPTSLTVYDVQSRSARLQFVPGFDGKTLISTWIVEALVATSSTITEIDRISAPDSRNLTIRNLRPFTLYKLRILAENVKGRSVASNWTEEFETLQAAPDAVDDDVEAYAVSSHSVKISWTPLPSHSWNGVQKGYEVSYSVYNDTLLYDRRVRNLNNTLASEIEIDQLLPYTRYYIWLCTLGEIGRSDARLTTAKTYEAAPSQSPANFSLVYFDARSITVRWDAISKNFSNGIVTGYKLQIANGRNPNLSLRSFDVNALHYEYKFDELHPYTTYFISVNAFTLAGNGPQSQITAVTKEGVPEAPSELIFPLINPMEVRLTWKPPYHSNGIIKHYSIAYWPNKTVHKTTSVKTTLNADLHMFVATGLSRDVPYLFAVAAETGGGWGPEAQALVITSGVQRVPGSPSRPILSQSMPPGSDRIAIQFDHDFSPTNRFFVVDFRRRGVQSWRSWNEKVPGLTSTCTIGSLTPNTAYAFRVRCVNDFGESRNSLESDWIKTAEAPPTREPWPINLRVINSSTISITFDAPPVESWNSDEVGFRITNSEYNFGENVETIQKPSTLEMPMIAEARKAIEIEINNLIQFRHYVFRIQAFNRQGSGPMSDAVFIHFGHSLPKFSVDSFAATPLSSSEIRLSWKKWAHSTEPIIGYKINYNCIGNCRHRAVKQEVVRGQATNFTLNDLSKFAEYQLEIAVFNRAGEGPWTHPPVRTKTFGDKPGPVSDLIFSDVQLDSVNVSWTSPLEPNGEILGYAVVYKAYRMAGDYIKQIQEKTKRHFLHLSGLEENVTLIVGVQAETAMGYGPIVYGEIAVGPQSGSPSTPGRPEILPSEDSVRLTWTKPHSFGYSPITFYIVQHKAERSQRLPEKKDPASMRIRRDTLETSFEYRWKTLANLDQFEPFSSTSYIISYADLVPDSAWHRFRIVARNSQGISYPSQASDPIFVPEGAGQLGPFYVQWWFLVILAILSLIIIVSLATVLHLIGKDRKFDNYGRDSAASSVQAIGDNAIVAYEMSHQRRRRNAAVDSAAATTDFSSTAFDDSDAIDNVINDAIVEGKRRDDVIGVRAKKRIADDDVIVVKGDVDAAAGSSTSLLRRLAESIMSSPSRDCRSRRENVYETDDARRFRQTAGGKNLPSFYETVNVAPDSIDDIATLTTNRKYVYNEPEISSIVQHYQTSNDLAYHRETWRKAVKSAASQHLDESCSSSDSSAANHVNAPPSFFHSTNPTATMNVERQNRDAMSPVQPICAFSSFV